MHSPLFTQVTHFSFLYSSPKRLKSLSLSRYSSARGPSQLDTTANDIVDKDSENTHTKKIMTGRIITLEKYKVMENVKSLLLNYASNTPSYIYFFC